RGRQPVAQAELDRLALELEVDQLTRLLRQPPLVGDAEPLRGANLSCRLLRLSLLHRPPAELGLEEARNLPSRLVDEGARAENELDRLRLRERSAGWRLRLSAPRDVSRQAAL